MIFLLVSLFVFCITPKVNIVFLGNSITYGEKLDNCGEDAPPLVVQRYLKKKKYEVEIANCGSESHKSVSDYGHELESLLLKMLW